MEGFEKSLGSNKIMVNILLNLFITVIFKASEGSVNIKYIGQCVITEIGVETHITD